MKCQSFDYSPNIGWVLGFPMGWERVAALGFIGLGCAVAVGPRLDMPRPPSAGGSCRTGVPIAVSGGAGPLGRHSVPQ